MKFLREDKQSELSVEAQKFLLQYPQFEDQIKKFEQKFEIENTLKSKNSFIDFISYDVYPDTDVDYYVDDDIGDDANWSDFKVIDVDYFEKDNKLNIDVQLEYESDITILDRWHYGNRWEPGYYDYHEGTAYANIDFAVQIPEDVNDEDSYIVDISDDDFDYYVED